MAPRLNKNQPARSDKRDKFLRLAEKRTRVVLKKLQVLGNCSNTGSYEYTSDDVERIFGAIEDQVARIRARFDKTKDIDFKLR